VEQKKRRKKANNRGPSAREDNPSRIPEILAPAGSLTAFSAAVEAGADAVYLGLKEFSARAYAENFSLSDLSRLVPLAHERGVKVFVAFNSLVKERDLAHVTRLLDGLAIIGPDAIILQDLGVLRLVKKHFPALEVHASTLTTIHNQSGIHAAEKMGFERVVLARELTLNEIGRLTRNTRLGLEIFVHGALCFSFSGLCLMSSFLGGRSSLRGACTQPCRRRYKQGKKGGYFFSPTDLSALELIPAVKKLNLAALKIEGRMKGAHYVGNVVRAYRLLLDAADHELDHALAEARTLVENSLGRTVSTGFFLTPLPEDTLAPNLAATSGIFLGSVQNATAKGVSLKLKSSLNTGDRLRIQYKQSGEQKAFRFKEMTLAGEKIQKADEGEEIFLYTPFAAARGDLVFKVDIAKTEKSAQGSGFMEEFKKQPPQNLAASPRLKQILRGLKNGQRRQSGRTKREIWYKIGQARELPGIAELNPDRIILPLTRQNLKRSTALRRRLGPVYERIIWLLPPVLFDSKLKETHQDLATLRRQNARAFMISNLGHLGLIEETQSRKKGGEPTVFADYQLNCLNTETEYQLKDLGLEGIVLSIENSERNLKQMMELNGPIDRLLYIYGRPALFHSRLVPKNLKESTVVESPRRERFRLRLETESTRVFAEKPIFFGSILKFKSLAGVKALIIDLENDPHPLSTAREVKKAVTRGKPLKGTSNFNFKRGLF